MNGYGCRADKIYEMKGCVLQSTQWLLFVIWREWAWILEICSFFYMSYLLNGRQGIPKGQSKMDNPEKLATLGTQDENKRWTPLCENTHI
jgi:hypothetical protein